MTLLLKSPDPLGIRAVQNGWLRGQATDVNCTWVMQPFILGAKNHQFPLVSSASVVRYFSLIDVRLPKLGRYHSTPKT